MPRAPGRGGPSGGGCSSGWRDGAEQQQQEGGQQVAIEGAMALVHVLGLAPPTPAGRCRPASRAGACSSGLQGAGRRDLTACTGTVEYCRASKLSNHQTGHASVGGDRQSRQAPSPGRRRRRRCPSSSSRGCSSSVEDLHQSVCSWDGFAGGEPEIPVGCDTSLYKAERVRGAIKASLRNGGIR